MFGLYPRKGPIAVGSDADLVVYDPRASFVYSAPDTIHGNIDYTAYEGMEINARIDKVLSRGKVIIDGDRYVGSRGDGSYLKRGMSQMLI
jgi:dihydropyrimidinase